MWDTASTKGGGPEHLHLAQSPNWLVGLVVPWQPECTQDSNHRPADWLERKFEVGKAEALSMIPMIP